jgi:hypothetical protein
VFGWEPPPSKPSQHPALPRASGGPGVFSRGTRA